MHGEHERHAPRHLEQPVDQRRERCTRIDVRRPVQRHDAVAAGRETQVGARRVRLDRAAHHLVAVDHDVADALDALGRHALAQQVLVTVARGRPQHVGDRVGHEPVDLFGHAPVATAQPSLEMHDRDPQLRADHRAGSGRIDVADHDDPVGLLRHRHLLVGDHHAAGLLGVRTAADLEVEMRLRHREVAEERIGHVRIVVLAGVHDRRPAPGLLRQRMVQRRDLHEVRARRRDQVDVLHRP